VTLEFGPHGITVNAVAPGLVRTDPRTIGSKQAQEPLVRPARGTHGLAAQHRHASQQISGDVAARRNRSAGPTSAAATSSAS